MGLDALLTRLEELLAQLERLPEEAQVPIFEFLDGLDTLHRAAVEGLADELDEADLARVAAARPEVSWLLMAYGIAVDQRPEAEAALQGVLREVTAQGGTLEILEAREGVVRVRLAGASGMDSPGMLERRIEDALRGHMPSFDRVEVEREGSGRKQRTSGIALPIHHVTPAAEDR